MMTGALLIRQKGEGCDHMIACGKDWRIVAGPTLDHVMMNSIIRLEKEGFCSGDPELDIVWLVVNNEEFSLLKEYHKRIAENKMRAEYETKRQADEKEHAEYERLQQKFGAKD